MNPHISFALVPSALKRCRRQMASTFDPLFQRPVAFCHQDEEHHIGDAEDRAKGDVRQAALRPVINGRPGVGQFVERADEDQIRVAPQITARNQKM